jgi:hypothetical protein
VKNTVKHWHPDYQSDPRYVELQTKIASVTEEIKSLSAGGFGRIIDRNLIGERQTELGRLRDRRNELKSTFLVSREIEIHQDAQLAPLS